MFEICIFLQNLTIIIDKARVKKCILLFKSTMEITMENAIFILDR